MMERSEMLYRLFFAKGGKSRRKKKDGIHINPKNEGKFTESARRAGMGVQEFAAHVLAHKENYDALTVRRANFARNFGGAAHRKAKKQEGGDFDVYEDDTYSGIPDIEFFASDTDNPVWREATALSGGLTEWMGGGGMTGSEAFRTYGNNTDKFNTELAGLFSWDDDRRIDFRKYKSVNGRRFDAGNMNRIQDSLIRYGIPAAQRCAILSSILQESGGDPASVDSTGTFYGLCQWSRDRLGDDESLYGDLEGQISKIADEIKLPREGDWTDGAKGGERVAHAHEGRWDFMSCDDPVRASLLFNKCYIRPYAGSGQEKSRLAAYDTRGKEAKAMFDLLASDGAEDQERGPLDIPPEEEEREVPDFAKWMEDTFRNNPWRRQ